MEILGIIPARGGSKGIKNKNLVSLCGHPLITYTFKAVLKSRRLSRTILSTDDAKIARLARLYRIEVPFIRPQSLAKDKTPMLDVILHALDFLKKEEGYAPDAILLLQPTSPLRNEKHIDSAVELLEKSGADTVVTVVEIPHQFSPGSALKLRKDGTLVPFVNGPLILRRQDKPRFYSRNGPAVLLTKRRVLNQGRLYGKKTVPLIMRAFESVDIDLKDDISLAKYWMKRK